jgi:hypothetical protein
MRNEKCSILYYFEPIFVLQIMTQPPSAMKPGFTLILFIITLNMHAQVIPVDRQVNWSDALLSYQVAVPVTEINVMDFGATGNGTTNDQPAVMNAIASLNGNLGYIYFPPGNYLLNAIVSLPDSAILKGFSPASSVLLFNFNGASQDCIFMAGSPASVFVQIDSGFIKGNYRIYSDSASLFNPADYAEIIEENGSWDDQPETWAMQVVGQIVQIDHVNDDTIFLMSPLRITYEAGLNPRIRKLNPRVNAGVECLKIKRLDQATSGANILLSIAANCAVRGVESEQSVAAHVDIFQSTRILVEGNYFHHAFEYDGGSKRGYGVTLNAHSGECLITNNIFRYLRHAMMVKTGANGNVFSYNYSREVHRSEPLSNYGGDISLHGHYAYANLFEGNIVQNINIDHEGGPSGPFNTFFRNRAELYGIIFSGPNPTTTSNSEHIVGNDVSYILGSYIITGSGHIEHGNNIHGTIRPSGTGTLTDTSYYLTEEPVFWDVSNSWPSLGIPNPIGTGTNPAKARWDQGTGLTVCPLRKEWTGSVSSDWSNPHNWDPYGVPDLSVEVTIPQSATSDPQISSSTVQHIRSITIGSNSGLQLLNGSSLIIMK